MKIRQPLVFFILLAFLSAGCHKHPAGDIEARSGVLGGSMDDSLRKYDTLSYQSRTTNPTLSILYAKKVMEAAKLLNTPESYAKGWLCLGNAYNGVSIDTAYAYYIRSKRISDSLHLERTQSILNFNLARMYAEAGNTRSALLLLDTALMQAKASGNDQILADAYNELSNLCSDLGDTAGARANNRASLDYARKHGLTRQAAAALENAALMEPNPLLSMRYQKEAITVLRSAPGLEEELAAALINLGNRFGQPDSSIRFLKEALHLMEKINFPELSYGAWNTMAYCYMDKGDPASAGHVLADLAIPLAEKNNNMDWLATLYDSYADVLEMTRDYKSMAAYEKKALEARAKASDQKALVQIRLLGAMLDVSRKDGLIREREIEIDRQGYSLQRMTTWLILAGFVIAGFVILLLWLRQRSKNRMNLERLRSAERIIRMEESEKGRYSRELHDTIGHVVQGLSGYIGSLEVQDSKVKDDLRGRVNEIGDSIRQLSHRMNRVMTEKFSFSELITGLCEDTKKYTGMHISYYIPPTLPWLPADVSLHIYRIVQELLTNAGKYARDADIRIKASIADGKLILICRDNGPGFDAAEAERRGLGVGNIRERVRFLHGEVSLKTAPGEGTRWEFTIPFESIDQAIKES
jgi:signal transduction histidine kinase